MIYIFEGKDKQSDRGSWTIVVEGYNRIDARFVVEKHLKAKRREDLIEGMKAQIETEQALVLYSNVENRPSEAYSDVGINTST